MYMDLKNMHMIGKVGMPNNTDNWFNEKFIKKAWSNSYMIAASFVVNVGFAFVTIQRAITASLMDDILQGELEQKMRYRTKNSITSNYAYPFLIAMTYFTMCRSHF